MIEFISILCKGLFESYFLITFLLYLSSIFLIDESEEILVLDLLNEYTLSFLLYLVVEVEVKPLRWAIDYFIFWLILDWLDFSNPYKLVLS